MVDVGVVAVGAGVSVAEVIPSDSVENGVSTEPVPETTTG
jgi:hypothetical protein